MPSKQAAQSALPNRAVARLAWRANRGPLPHLHLAARSYFFTSGQSLASRGLAASSGEIVAISL